MKVRQWAVAVGGKRILARAAWLGVITVALFGLGASTCGYTEGVLIPCDDNDECDYYPGTVCTNEMCVCKGEGQQFCRGECRLIAECWPGSGSAGGGGGGAGGQSGECVTAADCKQPGDPRCGTATCTGGVCGLDLKPTSKIASQRAGDCKEKWCDGEGNLVEYIEASDFYKDGLPCTSNFCEAGNPVTTLVPDGDTCPVVGEGVCYGGECVECIQGFTDCSGASLCDNIWCVALPCSNNQFDPAAGETGFNCGGPCSPCFMGSSCKVGSDCLSGVCLQGVCQGATCSDGVRNNDETGPDCGGPPSCPRCPETKGCKLASDCLSGVCWDGVCMPPSCTDGVQNGDETGEDCGGPCAACF